MLWTYRHWHPVYKQLQVLDCYAETVELALKSAQRWVNRQNRQFRKLGLPCRLPFPSHPTWMRRELSLADMIGFASI